MRHLLTLALFAILALFSTAGVELDGALTGRCSVGLFQTCIGRRCVRVAFVPIRPNRVYYKL
jgi:hypothetical protein